MNNYEFDYVNYLTNIPGSMNYSNGQKINFNMMPNLLNQSKIINGVVDDVSDSKSQTLDLTEGFIRGNLFKNLYDPYKNYKPGNVEAKNEREALLYQIMQYKFALIDLNLYLDNYPNNQELIKLYNKYLNIEKQMCDKYESKYGPLTLNSDYLNKNTWVWKNSPWPWEVM